MFFAVGLVMVMTALVVWPSSRMRSRSTENVDWAETAVAIAAIAAAAPSARHVRRSMASALSELDRHENRVLEGALGDVLPAGHAAIDDELPRIARRRHARVVAV